MYADLSGGFEFVSDTNAHTGRFSKIYFKEDTVISAITVKNATGNSLAGETFVADTEICGIITSITLTSGACLAYNL
jgi:hypothetical protein|tara:strand:+ start:356 stop:586 length:231 start_codon:yes stop_codon:yes gene_type:complete